jgi:glycosyltransferase involved in cell wall biosynthesis
MAASQEKQTGAAQEVSIVISTLDRQEELARAIHSILTQEVDARRYEIVVVDNGSRDRTREVVADIMARAPQVRYVHEPTLGLSVARNRGMRESHAPIIAFFDDDGTAEPGWLAAMLEVFRDDPNAGAAGGLIRVAWPSNCDRPEWMPMELQGYYGGCDYGSTRRYLSFPQYPYGPNMMIRREHLVAIGGFSETVGPTGQNIMAGDELDVFQRLFERGIKVVYEPRAAVRHWVPPERLTRKWLLRRAYKHGFSNTRLAYIRAGATRLTWLRLLGRAACKSTVACISGTLGVLGRVGNSVVTSRYARMTYWAGVARGARDGLVHGNSFAPSLR